MEHAAPSEHRDVRVTNLELFFDLVFVFTLTQLTGVLADDPTWRGLAKVVVLLSVIWWMYDAYVWLTNSALDVLGHRFLLLGGMAGFLVMALAIPTTFDDGGLAFGLGYLAVVALHSWLYLRETSPTEAEAMRGIVPYNLVGALMLCAAGIVGGGLKWAFVAVPAVLFWIVPSLAGIEGFAVAAGHFVERHALLVIVALGESIVVLGVGAAGAEVGIKLAVVAVLALALSAALWWTYFSHEEEFHEAMREAPAARRPQLAVQIGYAHFFLLLAVVLVAAGLKKAIPDPFGDFGWDSALVIPVGAALFVAADTALLRLLGVSYGRGRLFAVVAPLAAIPLGVLVIAVQIAAVIAAVTVTLGFVSARPRAGSATPRAR